jgi:hypothetical protein
MGIRLVFASFILATSPVLAQSYAGMQARSIKSLSEQQVADLSAGRGMGLALAAELNGYPGRLMFWSWPTNSICPPTSVMPEFPLGASRRTASSIWRAGNVL